MTLPTPGTQQAYLQSSGTGTIYPTLFFPRSPSSFDISYQPTQRWVDTSNSVTSQTFSAISQANPCVITATNTFSVGQIIFIEGVGGMTQLNNNFYTITAVSGTSITLNVDSTGFTAFTSGGTATAQVPLEYILLGFFTRNGYIQANWALISEIGAGGGGSVVTETLTGNNTVDPVSPTNGNINTIGTGSITILGNQGTSTLTTELTGLTNHAVLVGAGTATITNVGPPGSGQGFPLLSNYTSVPSDPAYSTTFLVNDSAFLANLTGASPAALVQVSINNTSATSGSSSRCIISADNATGTGADGYTLYRNGSQGYAVGVQGSTNELVFRYNAGSSSVPMNGTTSFALDASGNAYLPTITSTTVSNAKNVTINTSTGQLGVGAVPASVFTSISVQTFVYTGSPQIYTPTAGMLYCIIEVVGGGGGGGGAATSVPNTSGAGGGGGSGGYSRLVASAATIGVSQSVTIGAAGAAGAAGANDGGRGGTTSVGSGPLVSATGGFGGTGSGMAAFTSNAAGGGGSGSGGDFNVNGNPGGVGWSIGTLPVCVSGIGGSLWRSWRISHK